MKSKTVLILLLAVAALAIVAALVLRSGGDSKATSALNRPLLADVAFDRIEGIQIISREDTTRLEKGEDGWVVAERKGYPADFPRISDLVKKLREAKIGRTFAVDEDIRTRLALKDPSEPPSEEAEAAVRIRLTDETKNAAADILIGSARKADTGFGGQYLMHAGGGEVFLVDREFKYLSLAPAQWIRKEVVKIDGKQVRSLACYRSGEDRPVFELVRKEPGGAPAFAAPAPEGRLDEKKARRLIEALSPLQTEDVAPAEDAADFSQADRFVFRLFDGRRFTVELGKSFSKGEETFRPARLRADFEPPAQKAPEEKSAKPDSTEDLSAAVDQLNDRLAPWNFILAGWAAESFITDPAKLTAEPEE